MDQHLLSIVLLTPLAGLVVLLFLPSGSKNLIRIWANLSFLAGFLVSLPLVFRFQNGLPGFQFIQDPMDYDTRTHHSNMDVYERIQEPDMKQMAVIVASFVYLTANRDEMIQRKPLPKPRPARVF